MKVQEMLDANAPRQKFSFGRNVELENCGKIVEPSPQTRIEMFNQLDLINQGLLSSLNCQEASCYFRGQHSLLDDLLEAFHEI
jgi:hypothetical protein